MRAVPQPAKGHLALRRITNRKLARELHFSDHYVGQVLNGYERPSSRFRSSLSAFLGLPESVLFRDENERVAG